MKFLKTFIIFFVLLFLFISPVNAQSEIKKTDHLTSTISQKDFSTDEIPQIKINKTNPQNLITFISQIFGKKQTDLKDTIKIVITNPDNKTIDSSHFQITVNSNNQIQIAVKTEDLTPGKYEIKITDSQTNETVIQDFTWGVLVINPDQSVYSIGNTAFLAMAVLDESGDMVCDADLTLTVTSPDNSVSELSLSTGTITRNSECRTKNITLIPDFQAFLPLSQIGIYQLKLTAITKNGSYSITDSLSVESNPDFIIKRLAATRIYPPNNYPVTLEITSSQDFVGTIIEKVPLNFIISNTNAKITKDSSSQILSWETSLKAFQTTSYSYSYLAPQISPALYFLGPINLTNSQNQTYTEARSWQIAADVIPGSLNVTSVGTTYWTVPTGVYSITIEAWGGGGGGGVCSSWGWLGGGGGGGAYSKKNNYSVTPGNSLLIHVGEMGSSGNNGGDSYVVNTSTILAVGGSGAGTNNGSGAIGGPAASGVGDTKYSGGNGSNGHSFYYSSWWIHQGGGGGGGAGSSSNGSNGTTGSTGSTAVPNGGNGGSSYGGDGGDGEVSCSGSGHGEQRSDASNGSSYGGGGGGCVWVYESLPTTGSGIGGRGRVVISYLINEAPNTPTNSTPATGTTGVSITPTLTASSFSDPEAGDTQAASQFQVSTNTGFTSIVWQTGTTGPASNSVSVGSALNIGTTYYWRVRYQDNHTNWSSYSSYTMFVTNRAPNTPTLSLPSNGTSNISLTPTFKTVTTDPDGNNLQYEVKICTNSSMSTGCQTFTAANAGWSGSDIGTSSFSSGTTATYIVQVGNSLAVDTTYYWKTRAIDPAGSNTYSGTQATAFSFVTLAANSPPNTPTLSLPSNGTSNISLTPTFKTVTTDPDGNNLQYEVKICTNSSMSTGCQTFTAANTGWSGANVGTTSYSSGTTATYIVQVGNSLAVDTTYYWKTRAIDPAGSNTYSGTQATAFSFVTLAANSPPNTPTLSLPSNGTSNISLTPTFKTVTTDPDGNNLQYEVKICTNSSMSTGCQTFTAANTGWSGANVGTTSYSSGTTATYIVQVGNSLATDTIYYWKTRAIDTTGSNTWSGYQPIPFSFTTVQAPISPGSLFFRLKGIKVNGIKFK